MAIADDPTREAELVNGQALSDESSRCNKLTGIAVADYCAAVSVNSALDYQTAPTITVPYLLHQHARDDHVAGHRRRSPR
ncbi:hypothetical protein WMF37_20535 [Sorangium sp. So ce291]|uniref:hypothetical protein n=1 Tax=Sorangium sp. So ce291 TaxID=3133294 RepID=UPI003F6419B7